ncbi:MAG: Cyclic di-GMP phosphodiesterase response regulator RpfG [Verrucomicrobiota bacterium]|jgi:response regulator RpfG family c-di-GMP phosphodiesterase
MSQSTLPANKPRILVVDDEEIVLAALRETLHRAGYEVTAVPDALRALEFLPTTPFAAIISDYQMPRMTGLDFLAQAKVLQPDASRILITAVLTLGTVIEAINTGEIYRFIVKPWLREELLASVRNAVQRHELLRHNSALQSATAACNHELSAANQSLAAQVQLAEGQRAALTEQVRQHAELTLRTLETIHPLLGRRARRARDVARALIATLTLSEADAVSLELAASLHDVGLLAVSHELVRRWLEQPETVTDDERALLRPHPITGQELIACAPEQAAAALAVRGHHEHFDGTGYPDNLAGEKISWLARLLAVVAAYADAEASDGAAVEQIKFASGTQFDAEAVRALLRVLPGTPGTPRERAVLLAELQPGMVVASAIYTAHGLLLVPEGQPLNEPTIDKLRNHHHTTPITQSLLVYG